VFLNRRDASRYMDLKPFLLGLEIFMKHLILLILKWIRNEFLNLVRNRKMLGNNLSKTYITLTLLEETTYNTGSESLKNILTGTATQKFFLNRDLKPKRLRNTDLSPCLFLNSLWSNERSLLRIHVYKK